MNKKRILPLVVAIIMLVAIMPTAYAATDIDHDRQINLNLIFTVTEKEIPATEVEFRLYKVAEFPYYCRFDVTETFGEYMSEVDFTEMDQDKWMEMAATLAGYVSADKIKPDYVVKSDEEGIARIADIEGGLYLIEGDTFHYGRNNYMPDAFMYCLPMLDKNDEWVYEVKADIKKEVVSDSEPVDLEIMKVWSDNNSSTRPKSVDVEIYDGETLYGTVTLSGENNWRTTLEDMYGGTTWTVKEKAVPEGYKVSVEKQGNRIVVTNTCDDNGGNTTPEKLPQTGMLWWPVPILCFIGLTFILLGVMKRKNDGNE